MENEERLYRSSEFGRLLRRHRLAAGLSQEALAERARMSSDGISALERGHRRTPQRETRALLASALALDEAQREEFEAAAARSGPARRPGGSVTVGPWGETGSSNLPLALKSFVGRDAELEEIVRLVREHRLVTMTGAGGVGKTETALHAGRALSTSAGTVVCFVGLASVSDASSVVTAVASALDIQEAPNRPLLDTVVTHLKNKALLLIVDNCEHVLMQVAEVAEAILGSCGNVKILATSREPLRAPGEQRYRLPSLSVPTKETASRIGATEATTYGAIALFSDRARDVDHRFAIADENAPTVAEVCRRLDGIPLAIELAAARVSQPSLQALAERLENRFRILTIGERTARVRQQTMRATIDWSYELLSASEQRVFERLSVFAGGCALASAAAVCADGEMAHDDVLDLLSSLVDKSLLMVDSEGSEPRYRLLESFRQYAREKLMARAEQETTVRRHALAYLELAQPLDRIVYYEPDEALVARALRDLDNWRSALHWALIDRGDVELGQRMVGALCVLWQNYAPVEGRRWVACALDLVDERTPTTVLARLNYTEATLAMTLEQYELQRVRSTKAAEQYRVAGDLLGVVLAQAREGQALLHLGRVGEAQSVLRGALPLARTVGNRWLVAFILRMFAYVAGSDFAAARGYLAEALRLYQEAGGKFDIAFTMMDLSGVESLAGNAELALQYATDALALFRSVNHARGVSLSLHLVARCLFSFGRYDEAETSAREGLDLAREHRLEVAAACALQLLAAVAALRPQRIAGGNATALAGAARILGFFDACPTARDSAFKLDEHEYCRVQGALRDALGAEVVVKLMAEGAAMTEEQVVGEARTV